LFHFAAQINMGKGQEVISQASSTVKVGIEKAWESVSPYAKTALHWGFIPAIIVVGMTCTDPKPTIAQLVGPM
jgi:import receptor subunit TOM7